VAMVPDSTAANGQRGIMISSSDYDRFHKGDSLPVTLVQISDSLTAAAARRSG
jgi:hypothetical protein